jgi:integrase
MVSQVVAQQVVRVDGADVVGTPKSAAGVRVIAIPPHLVPVIAAHTAEHVGPGREALLFPHSAEEPKRHMTHARYYGRFHMPAREAAGRPDLRFHDLRHTGATLVAQTGAALRYQHAAQGRDAEIARLLSVMAEPPKRRKGKGRRGAG